MSTQVTLNLPDDVAATAVAVAHSSHQDVNELLQETIQSLFGSESPLANLSFSSLTNEQVLQLAHSQMPASQSDRLANLHRLQSERPLDLYEMAERDALMHFYTNGTLIKAHAITEAVRRKLQVIQP